MLNSYSDEQLRLAARLYYLDGLAQSEVARFVKISQAKVSRLLAAARERGIVRISVAEYEPRNQVIERALRKQFGLGTVVVIKTSVGATSADARRVVGHFAAPVVAALLPPKSVVAIAGGRTIRELIQLLPEDKERQLTVVQAMGSIDSSIGPEDALELARILARRSGGRFEALNTPAFVPDQKTRDTFRILPQIRYVHQQLTRANVAIVGVGTLTDSVFVARNVLSPHDLKELAGEGAVGEICGRFYDKHGKECVSRWRDRVLSIELEQLRRTPQVIGVVAGGDRSAAIAAAIRGGLLKALIIDEQAAQYLCGARRAAAPSRPDLRS
ncbi:MAG TPA: sugar-binding domain-containing protein [Candidatus Paceibacterota bacterium]|nr:sugar-binding domain-containing protein [Verrucomicrobiota bacterium]HSA10947.1 sugar-binding domain-containing protein [Candidatus Paceibacterota bacterium]